VTGVFVDCYHRRDRVASVVAASAVQAFASAGF
jgi:hypothetical protein